VGCSGLALVSAAQLLASITKASNALEVSLFVKQLAQDRQEWLSLVNS